MRRRSHATRESLTPAMLAREQLKKGKLREALRSLKHAVRLHRDPGYDVPTALLYLESGRSEEALQLIRAVVTGGCSQTPLLSACRLRTPRT